MNTRTVIGLLSLLYSVLQCQCYDPVSKTPASIPPSLCQNTDLNFVNDVYGYVKPAVAVVTESPQPVAGKYWWLNKKSPFGIAVQGSTANVAPISGNEVTNVKYESNPFINSFKESSCNGYSCGAKVPCVEEGYICAPQYLCQNGVINKNQLNQVPSAGKFCAASKEICCKISYSCEGNECYQNPGFTQTVAVISPYPPSLPPSVSVVSPSGYANPEYNAVSSISPAPTPAPTPVPYTGPQNSTPYPGCPAALKCVPDNYCTLEGVMSDIPVVLTKEALLNRVPLSECLDVPTGIVGKCCRDPNYKDPWPDHDSHDHDHGHDHNHSHEHTEYNTEAPQTHYTIKKPVGGYSGSSSSGSSVNQYEVTNTYVPPSSSQVYIPPSQTYIPPQPTYAPPLPTASYIPPKPDSTYSPPQPVSSYIPPQPAPTYSPPQPVASYIPPQPAPTYSPPQPIASYVPPKPAPTYSPPQPVVSYIPPTHSPQPAANYYVPPQQSQATGGSYYKPGTITLSRQPYEPPLFASDRVYEKSAISPFVTKQEYYSQCGVRVNDGTEFGDAPWHAVIYSTKNKDLICGAAIVSENAILTSAHCVEKGDSDSLVVQAGPSSKVYKTAVIVHHPQYDSNTLVKDLALIVLKEAIKFDSNTQKICLPSPQSQEQSYNKECYLSTLADHYNPASLQKLKIQTFHYKDCDIKLKNTYLGKQFILNESFTCASTPTEAELCQVKSGEPVACDRGDGIYELYGIKSWDLGCQEYKKTAIFSNSDVQWIENTLVAPLEKLITLEQIYQREKFNGVNIQEKASIASGYQK